MEYRTEINYKIRSQVRLLCFKVTYERNIRKKMTNNKISHKKMSEKTTCITRKKNEDENITSNKIKQKIYIIYKSD